MSEASTRSPLSHQVTLSKAGGSVAYSLQAAPTGMSISPTGLVTWTPSLSELGTAPTPTIVATRDGETATQAWTLRVHQGVRMGVTLSPRGHTNASTEQDYLNHFQNRSNGKVVAFHGKWRDSVSSAGSIPALALLAISESKKNGYIPVIGLGWSDGNGSPDLTSDSNSDNSWNNSETRSEFLAMVEALARDHAPPYLFLGNEVNSYYVTHSQGEWTKWIEVYQAAYDVIKAASPSTFVFTTFNLEKMAGGGAKNGWAYAPHWQLIADHGSKLDGVGFTSYPYFDFDTPSAISSDYYTRIESHWTGPLLFTELGWKASATVPYAGSEADQAAFVSRFFELTGQVDLEYVAWLFEHDWHNQASVPAFIDIGFKDNLGNQTRMAATRWAEAVSLRER